jgi:hypothetical protein
MSSSVVPGLHRDAQLLDAVDHVAVTVALDAPSIPCMRVAIVLSVSSASIVILRTAPLSADREDVAGAQRRLGGHLVETPD